MHKILKFSAPLLGVAIVTVASAVLAVDSKIYSGSSCQPANSVVSYLSNNGTIQNTFNTKAAFACPIDRDEVLGTSSFTVTVNVSDTSTTDNVNCQAFAHNTAGTVISTASAGTGVATTGDATLTLNVPTTGSAAGDYYRLSCNLPPTLGLVRSYRVLESEQTN